MQAPEKPILLLVPPAPVPPQENDENYSTKLSNYQKSFQIYAQARSFNSDAESKYLKAKQENDKAISLLKNCFRPSENSMVFSHSEPPKTVNAALARYESLFKATELSGNDLISWFKQLVRLKLIKPNDVNAIYLWIQSLVTNANLYREIVKRKLVTKDLQGNDLDPSVAELVNSVIASNDEEWSLLFYTSQYLESPPDSPFFSELTSRLTTSGFGNFKTLQMFLDQLLNLAQSMLTSAGTIPDQDPVVPFTNNVQQTKKRFHPYKKPHGKVPERNQIDQPKFPKKEEPKEFEKSNAYRCPLCQRYHQNGQKCSREVNIAKYLEVRDKDLAALFARNANKDKSEPYSFIVTTRVFHSSSVKSGEIIIDSGATDTMINSSLCPDVSCFKDFIPLEGHKAIAANGSAMEIVGKGTIRLFLGETVMDIPDCLYVPRLTISLISVVHLTKLLECPIIFTNNVVGIVRSDHSILEIGTKKDNLYFLSNECIRSLNIAQANQTTDQSTAIEKIQSGDIDGIRDGLYLLHISYGHMSIPNILKTLQCTGIKVKIPSEILKSIDPCIICSICKARQKPIYSSQHTATRLLDTDVVPLKGSIGVNYWMPIIDEYSRYISVYFINTKDKGPMVMQQYIGD